MSSRGGVRSVSEKLSSRLRVFKVSMKSGQLHAGFPPAGMTPSHEGRLGQNT